LERHADTVPGVEAEYQQLNRDYSVINAQYQEVVKRLETARLSGQAEQSEEVDFRTIEPAAVEPRPVAPRRLLLLPGVFAAAVVLGVWVALTLSQMNAVVYTAADVQRVAGLPVLGPIDHISTERNRRAKRWRTIGFATCAVILTGALCVIVGLEFLEVNWTGRLQALLL
jgi:protein tyrosine kinase modulator